MELNQKMGLGGFDKQERANCHTAASRTTGADRRTFLTALAAFAGNTTAASVPRGHIDVHHHFFPRAFASGSFGSHSVQDIWGEGVDSAKSAR